MLQAHLDVALFIVSRPAIGAKIGHLGGVATLVVHVLCFCIPFCIAHRVVCFIQTGYFGKISMLVTRVPEFGASFIVACRMIVFIKESPFHKVAPFIPDASMFDRSHYGDWLAVRPQKGLQESPLCIPNEFIPSNTPF